MIGRGFTMHAHGPSRSASSMQILPSMLCESCLGTIPQALLLRSEGNVERSRAARQRVPSQALLLKRRKEPRSPAM